MAYLHSFLTECFIKIINDFPRDGLIIDHVSKYIGYKKLSDQTIRWMIRDYHIVHKTGNMIKNDRGGKQKHNNKETMKKLMFKYGPIEFWDVENVTTLNDAFNGLIDFNYFIGKWDVCNVVSMDGTFYGTENFSVDISDWDVSNVQTMKNAFGFTKNFNANIFN